MKLILNGKPIETQTPRADMSALCFVRETLQLTGTKEGCASGDCGACTLIVASFESEKIKYETLNSCITPVQALENKHVITVEYLSDKDYLHPAQEAMVECHGSQCGFCTPGFIMSLASLFENVESANITRKSVQTAISGNLCRCTGYRPIVDAGLTMTSDGPTLLHRNLASLDSQEIPSGSGKDASENYFKPKSLTELHKTLLQVSEAKLISGGTDLMLESTQRYRDLPALIDLTSVPELTEIKEEQRHISIGAAVTYTQLQNYFHSRSEPLTLLLERIASTQIRNRGTVGGNIANASPIADLPPVFMALGATLHINSASGKSKVCNLESFYTAYRQTILQKEEYLSRVDIPKQAFKDFHRCYKVSKRIEDDISSVMLAVRFETRDDIITCAHIAYGGMAATPIRAIDAEQIFANRALDDKKALLKALSSLRSNLTPLSDVRASAEYRLEIACNLLEKAWRELNGEVLVDIGSIQGVVA